VWKVAKEPPRVSKIKLLRSVWIDGECHRVESGDRAKPVILSVGKGKQVSTKDARILVGEGAAEVAAIEGGGEAGPLSTHAAAALKPGGKKGEED
jgi:hypothetical protein